MDLMQDLALWPYFSRMHNLILSPKAGIYFKKPCFIGDYYFVFYNNIYIIEILTQNVENDKMYTKNINFKSVIVRYYDTI